MPEGMKELHASLGYSINISLNASELLITPNTGVYASDVVVSVG